MATPPPSRDGDETVDAVEHERLESLGETRTGREPPTSAREAEPWSYPDRTRIEHMSARTWASASEKSRLKLRKQVGRKPDSQKLRGDKKANELTLVRALPPPQIRGKEKGWQWAVCPPREYICSPLQHEWWAQFGDEWWEIGRARSKHEPYNKHKGCAVDAWDADWAATFSDWWGDWWEEFRSRNEIHVQHSYPAPFEPEEDPQYMTHDDIWWREMYCRNIALRRNEADTPTPREGQSKDVSSIRGDMNTRSENIQALLDIQALIARVSTRLDKMHKTCVPSIDGPTLDAPGTGSTTVAPDYEMTTATKVHGVPTTPCEDELPPVALVAAEAQGVLPNTELSLAAASDDIQGMPAAALIVPVTAIAADEFILANDNDEFQGVLYEVALGTESTLAEDKSPLIHDTAVAQGIVPNNELTPAIATAEASLLTSFYRLHPERDKRREIVFERYKYFVSPFAGLNPDRDKTQNVIVDNRLSSLNRYSMRRSQPLLNG